MTWLLLGLAFVGVLGLLSLRFELQPDVGRAYASRTLPPETEPVLLPPPPMNDDYVPCSDCHEGEPTNPQPRKLEDSHEETVLEHGDFWCLSCHDTDDRQKLRLSDGQLVEIEESWRLCTQCHGSRLEEWRAGVHGKRSGHWWGPKEYQSCVACHDPHAPRFKPIEPKPPPTPPAQILSRRGTAPEEATHEAP